MKVCIPSYGPTLDSRPQPVFGRCEYFIFVDPANLDFVSDPNPYASESDFSGIMSAKFVISKGATVLVTDQVGDRAKAILDAADVKIINTTKRSVRETIEALRNQLGN